MLYVSSSSAVPGLLSLASLPLPQSAALARRTDAVQEASRSAPPLSALLLLSSAARRGGGQSAAPPDPPTPCFPPFVRSSYFFLLQIRLWFYVIDLLASFIISFALPHHFLPFPHSPTPYPYHIPYSLTPPYLLPLLLSPPPLSPAYPRPPPPPPPPATPSARNNGPLEWATPQNNRNLNPQPSLCMIIRVDPVRLT